MTKRVVVHVSGGVAELVSAPKNVDVEILDFNNYEGVVGGSDEIKCKCPKCTKPSSQFDWNAATHYDFVKDNEVDFIDEIQKSNLEPETEFTCPHCFNTSMYQDIMSISKEAVA